MIVVLSETKILESLLEYINFKNSKVLKDINNLESQENTLVITDNYLNIPILKKKLNNTNKNAIIFVQGIKNSKEEHNLEKIKFLGNIVDQIISENEINTRLSYLPYHEKTLKDKFSIEGNIKNLPEETLDTIISFIEYFSLEKKLDIGNIIISTSEIIDNIIEAAIHLNKLSTKIDVSFSLQEKALEIRIKDYLGVAEIFSISKSLEGATIQRPIEIFTNEIIDQITPRGRGYTLISKTSDYVITEIVSVNCFKKYNELNPYTETSVIYFLEGKTLTEDNKLGIVIEFL